MRDDPEHRLSSHVDALLERILLEPCWFTAIERAARAQGATEEERKRKAMIWAQRLKKRGVKPAHLDWYAVQREPWLYSQWELKYGDNDTHSGQDTTIRLLTERNIPTAVCWSVLEVYQHLRKAGFRLHGNAENIAREIEARWRAADEGKRNGPAKPKRASKPRAAKPSQAQVRRLTAMRSRVLF